MFFFIAIIFWFMYFICIYEDIIKKNKWASQKNKENGLISSETQIWVLLNNRGGGGVIGKKVFGPNLDWPKTKPLRLLKPGQLCWPRGVYGPLDLETWPNQQIKRMGWEGAPPYGGGIHTGSPGWLNGQPCMAPSGEATWPPRVNPHYHIKTNFEREHSFAHFILSPHQKNQSCSATLSSFSVTSTTTTCQRRQWRPANRGGAAFFSGEPPLKT